MMQESLIEYKGITCDYCGKPSSNHIYHQVWIYDGVDRGQHKDIYLCDKCYKSGKDKKRG